MIQLKSSVQKWPKWQFWTTLHKTSKLSIFLQCYNVQWPKDLCYVANTLFLQYKWNFYPKNTNLVYFWPGKKSFQNAKKFLSTLLGVKSLQSVLTLGGFQTRLAVVDYLERKWCSRSFFLSKTADFVLPVTLSSPPSPTAMYSVTPGLHLQVPKPKPTNQNAHQKVLTQQLKQEDEHLPPYFDS